MKLDLKTVKSYDNNWWLKHLELTTVYDTKLIKKQFDWLIQQAEMVEKLEVEIKKRKKYEGFLKSVIKSGEDLNDNHTIEWFCELWGDILKD